MKNTFLFFILGLILFINFTECFAKKRALIIAVFDYDEQKTNWKKLQSTNDTVCINYFLKSQSFDFVTRLYDKNATKANILAAFKTLTNNAQEGDKIVVFFDGHGCQISDNLSGIQDEIDGLDEAFVPYDVMPYSPEKGMFNSNDPSGKIDLQIAQSYLLDDEIGNYFDSIRLKIGRKGDLVAFFDCCYSGTMSKGNDNVEVKGNKLPFFSNMINPKIATAKVLTPQKFADFNNLKNSNMADMAAFSASQSDVTAQSITVNGNIYGNIPYNLMQIAQNESKIKPTYDDLLLLLMKYYRENKNTNNIPELESSNRNKLFLGDEFIVQDPYFSILDRWISSDDWRQEYTINTGAINNIDSGSVYAVQPTSSNSDNVSSRIAFATVTNVGAFESTVITNKELCGKAYKFFPYKINYKKTKLLVFLDHIKGEEIIKEIVDDITLVEITENKLAADLIISNTKKNKLMFFNPKFNQPFDTIGINEPYYKENIQSIVKRFQNFITLTTTKYDDAIQVSRKFSDLEADIIPLKQELSKMCTDPKNILVDTLKFNQLMNEGIKNYKEGDFYALQLKNVENYEIHFGIIYISKDGTIKSLVPNKEISPQNCKFEKYLYYPMTFEAESIIETIVIFLGNQYPIDLNSLLTDNHNLQTIRNANLDLVSTKGNVAPMQGKKIVIHYKVLPK
jgi:hypothetical protein